MKLKIAIFGGSGYGGSELLRILLLHPNANLALVTANEHAGKAVSDVHKNLLGLTDLKFTKATDDLAILSEFDCVFFALPHGQAMEIAPGLPTNVKVIDLSGDFRLSDAAVFEQHYGREHTRMDAQSQFVYGLTETNRERIKAARCIANPGCFATATLLGLAPLVANSLVDFRVIVDRGIFASIYCETKIEMSPAEARAMFADFYRDSFFVRLVDGSPDINWVKTTNFCDIGFATRGRQLVVFTAIDNLVKGAAGQAVQNMNLMFGLDEKTGLTLVGTNP